VPTVTGSDWSDVGERLARLAAEADAGKIFGLTDLGTLAHPFPRVEAFNPADGLPDPPDGDDYDSPEAFNAAEDAYWEKHAQIVYQPEHSIGLLYLCHLGCALREALVVSGPARGTNVG
jgi:hypothetical protein